MGNPCCCKSDRFVGSFGLFIKFKSEIPGTLLDVFCANCESALCKLHKRVGKQREINGKVLQLIRLEEKKTTKKKPKPRGRWRRWNVHVRNAHQGKISVSSALFLLPSIWPSSPPVHVAWGMSASYVLIYYSTPRKWPPQVSLICPVAICLSNYLSLLNWARRTAE